MPAPATLVEKLVKIKLALVNAAYALPKPVRDDRYPNEYQDCASAAEEINSLIAALSRPDEAEKTVRLALDTFAECGLYDVEVVKRRIANALAALDVLAAKAKEKT
jgi:hypothetical protein